MRLVVWDLDETLWPDTTLERDPSAPLPAPDPAALDVVRALRERGIVNAIATRNPPSLRDRVLAEPWAEHFAAVRAGWGDKAPAVAAIAEQLDIALTETAYVDTDPFVRAGVEHQLPEVRGLAPDGLRALLPTLDRATTAEAARRTELYRDEARRRDAARAHPDRESFLASCRITLAVGEARAEDAPRVDELVARTNQYNSTGRRPADATVLVGELRDRFGDYGLVAAAFLREGVAELLLVSCRAAGKGCLEGMLHELARRGTPLTIPVVPTERNVPLRLALRAATDSATTDGDTVVFTLHRVPPIPDWLTLEDRS
ncbi:MAG TPA: hypothetical protein VF529_14050 [Solirubrobacteraceae bacterium]|jgi:FkbH-like protein